jgi:hypothetical protein
MPRYDEFYDRSGRYQPPARARTPRRWSRYRPASFSYDDEYLADDFGEYLPMGAVAESQERMGMHDFSEHYGRYSGGSPYSYEYSERTLYHRPRFYGAVGFTQPLGREYSERGLPSPLPPRRRRFGQELLRGYATEFERGRVQEGYRQARPGGRWRGRWGAR